MPFLETGGFHPINARSLKLIQNPGFWAVSLASLAFLAVPQPTQAQITPDGSLGTQVNGACGGTGGVCAIRGGSQREGNLFHSFQQFSLPNGDLAGFIVSPDVRNAIVRVTGVGTPFVSNINGTIGTFNETPTGFPLSQPVNFFLLNPNGIVFGANARIFVGGSFLATTAERMQFQDGILLSTRDPNPLLTISVPIGLQFSRTSGTIQSRMQIGAGFNSIFTDLALLGGDVTLDNSVIQAPGRRVELGSVAGAGTIGLTATGNGLSLSFPDRLLRADVAITNNSILDVASGGGSLSIFAKNLDISGSSRLSAGVAFGSGAFVDLAGDITLDVTNTLSLRQESVVGAMIDREEFGRAGNIKIEAGSLLITEGSQLGNSIFGTGDTGNLAISVRDRVVIDGESSSGFPSGIFSEISPSGRGTVGDIQLKTGSLQITNGAILGSRTFGDGNSSNIEIRATDQIVLDNGFIGVAVESSAAGQGGTIFILAGDSLEIRNGGRLSSSVSGFGDGGDIDIAAGNRIVLDNGLIGSVVFDTSDGRGGDIRIAAGDALEVRNGAELSSRVSGLGDGGNIEILVRDRVLIDGTSADNRFSSNIASTAASDGRGGNITIDGGTLQLSHGGQLNATTRGSGDGGNIALRVLDATTLTGWNAPSSVQTSINTSTATDGRGGNIFLDTSTLTISNNAAFNAVTTSRGSGGNIAVKVAGNLELLNGGQLNTTTEASGQTGRISLNADQILISGVGFNNQPSALTVQFTASSAAGEIELNARRLTLDNQGRIFSLAPSGNGGNLTLNIQDLFLLRRGSQVSVSAGTAQTPGNGGNITISAPNGFIVGVKSENSDITANAFTGSGGRVNIAAQGIYGLQFRPNPTDFSDITASSTFGVSGTVTLNTPALDPSRGLTELPENIIDTNRILATSCIVRQGSARGTFFITGNGGLPQRPGTPAAPWFPTGTVQAIPDEQAGTPPNPAPIVEMDEIYRLPNGQVILGRTCTTE